MEKRLYVFTILFLSIVFASFFLVAQSSEIVCEAGDDDCKINKGYSCLEEKIDSRGCASLSSGERVFSLLASGECRSEVEADNKFMSDEKYTAQAILALGGHDDAEEWLLTASSIPQDITWFLQIDSDDATTCEIDEEGSLDTIQLNADKTVSGSTGCLTASDADTNAGNYWFEVDRDCYGQEISVSCSDSSFLTSLLYKEDGQKTLYISEDTSSASAGGETIEVVDSSCFGQGTCKYEASLWSTLVLNSLNYDMSAYLPYLVTEADENEDLLPEAFLFLLVGDEFRNQLLGKQFSNKWWDESGERFYDTALALYAFQYENPTQKTNSIRWLLDESQGNDGCWDNGNILNTAFLLFSIEPRTLFGSDVGSGIGDSCESVGFSCMSGIACSQAGGTSLNAYSCSGTFTCCDQERVVESCSVQGGSICSIGEDCTGGISSDASDLSAGESCCVSGGTCQIPTSTTDLSECEAIGGSCRISSCLDGESESFESCDFSADLCCLSESKSSEGINGLWIWVLLILIIFLVLGIIFRQKLRPFWFKLKTGFNKIIKKKAGPMPGTQPGVGPSPMAYRGIPQMRPPIRRPPPRRPLTTKQPGELKDVLGKLKDMGR